MNGYPRKNRSRESRTAASSPFKVVGLIGDRVTRFQVSLEPTTAEIKEHLASHIESAKKAAATAAETRRDFGPVVFLGEVIDPIAITAAPGLGLGGSLDTTPNKYSEAWVDETLPSISTGE